MPQPHPDPLGWNSSTDNDHLDWNAAQPIPRSPRKLISQVEWTLNTTQSTAAGSQPPGWQFDIFEDPVLPRPPLHVRFTIVNHDPVELRSPWERSRPPSPAILVGSTDVQEIMQLAESHHTHGRVVITSSDHRITPRVVIPSGPPNRRRSRSEPVSRGNEIYLSDSPIARGAQAGELADLLHNLTEDAKNLPANQPVSAGPAGAEISPPPRSHSR